MVPIGASCSGIRTDSSMVVAIGEAGCVVVGAGVGDAVGDGDALGFGDGVGATGRLSDPPDAPPPFDDPPPPVDPPPGPEGGDVVTATDRVPEMGPAPVTVSVVVPVGIEIATCAVPFTRVADTGETPPVTVT